MKGPETMISVDSCHAPPAPKHGDNNMDRVRTDALWLAEHIELHLLDAGHSVYNLGVRHCWPHGYLSLWPAFSQPEAGDYAQDKPPLRYRPSAENIAMMDWWLEALATSLADQQGLKNQARRRVILTRMLCRHRREPVYSYGALRRKGLATSTTTAKRHWWAGCEMLARDLNHARLSPSAAIHRHQQRIMTQIQTAMMIGA